MNDPVRLGCLCDKNYERSELINWIKKHGCCKFCSNSKTPADIAENSALKGSIADFCKRLEKKRRRDLEKRLKQNGLFDIEMEKYEEPYRSESPPSI